MFGHLASFAAARLCPLAAVYSGAMRGPIPVLPSKTPSYNAGSAVDVPYVSRNGELEAVELTGLRYRVDNLTARTVVIDWTTVSEPEARGTVTIPANLNAIAREYNDRELMQVTFELTDAGGVRQQLAHYEICAVFQGIGS